MIPIEESGAESVVIKDFKFRDTDNGKWYIKVMIRDNFTAVFLVDDMDFVCALLIGEGDVVFNRDKQIVKDFMKAFSLSEELCKDTLFGLILLRDE